MASFAFAKSWLFSKKTAGFMVKNMVSEFCQKIENLVEALWYVIYCLKNSIIQTSLIYAFPEFFLVMGKGVSQKNVGRRPNILLYVKTLFSFPGL